MGMRRNTLHAENDLRRQDDVLAGCPQIALQESTAHCFNSSTKRSSQKTLDSSILPSALRKFVGLACLTRNRLGNALDERDNGVVPSPTSLGHPSSTSSIHRSQRGARQLPMPQQAQIPLNQGGRSADGCALLTRGRVKLTGRRLVDLLVQQDQYNR